MQKRSTEIRVAVGGKLTSRAKDWLIAFMLLLATIQCVRADFLVNETFIDWHAYSEGAAALPYQRRAAMAPILRWAGRSAQMKHLAARYAGTVTAGTKHIEPITVEKFTSMLIGIVSLTAMMLAIFFWSRWNGIEPWWLPNVLLLVMTAATLVIRATQNYWYAYDLPHAALFGIGALLLLEGCWVPALLCFAIDVPLRETSIFMVLIASALLWTRLSADRMRVWKTTILALAMGVYWTVVQGIISRSFAGNINETHPRLTQNLHELIFPHHWPQLFSAGGYLLIFIWLERRRLSQNQKVLLYSCVLCFPVTIWYGVWTESRVWLEWTVPMGALAGAEAADWMRRFGNCNVTQAPASLEATAAILTPLTSTTRTIANETSPQRD
jgi:hypothetical protein